MQADKLKGMAIVSLNEGSRLGRVEDLLIDTSQRRIVAIQCGDSGKRFIVPFEMVRNIGNDAITVESSQVTQVDGQNGATTTALRLADFQKLKAVDEDGSFIGTINQIDIDTADGKLLSLMAHKGGVLGLGGTTTAIAAENIRAIGPELVTVTNVTPPAE